MHENENFFIIIFFFEINKNKMLINKNNKK